MGWAMRRIVVMNYMPSCEVAGTSLYLTRTLAVLLSMRSNRMKRIGTKLAQVQSALIHCLKIVTACVKCGGIARYMHIAMFAVLAMSAEQLMRCIQYLL